MIKTGFILLTIALACLVHAGMAKLANDKFAHSPNGRRIKLITAFSLGGWLIYIAMMSLTGIFTTAALPPRIPLLLVFPVFLFMLYFFTSGRFKDIIAAVPPSWPVYLQSFRIVVELLLLSLFLNGLLPRAATFEGYNFDILIGLSAPIVGYLGFTVSKLSKPVIIIWNILGLLTLAIVVFIIIAYAYFPQLLNQQQNFFLKDFGIFPYTFLAGFFMPLAVFLHIFSIIQTTKIVKVSSSNVS